MHKNSSDTPNKDGLGIYRVVVALLRISPTYERARREAARLPVGEDLPADFQQVRETYKKFGDVRDTPFDQWWSSRGAGLFGLDGSDEVALPLAFTPRGQAPDKDCLESNWRAHLAQLAENKLSPASVVVSVALGYPIQATLDRIRKLLEWESKHTVFQEAPIRQGVIRFQGQHALSVTLRGVQLLMIRAWEPKLSEWRIGVLRNPKADLARSQDYISGKLIGNDGDEIENNGIDRTYLVNSTRRDLAKYKRIAENAARGVFFSEKPLKSMPIFDFEDIANRINVTGEWLLPLWMLYELELIKHSSVLENRGKRKSTAVRAGK